MTLLRSLLVALVAMAVLEVPATAGEGWELQVRTREPGGAEVLADVVLDGENLKLRAEGEPFEVIVGKNGITILSHGDQTYMTLTFEMIEMFAGSAGLQEKKLEDALQELEGEERARAEARLRQKPTVHSTGKTETIAGLKARQLEVRQKSDVLGHLWITEEIPSAILVGTLERMVGIAGTALGEEMPDLGFLAGLTGFPLRIEMVGGDETRVLEVTRVRRMKVTDSTFSRPGSYKPSFNLGKQ